MRAMDWVGLVLIGGVLVGGGIYFMKMRPLNPGAPAPVGVPVPVVAQGSYYAPPLANQNQNGGGDPGVRDANMLINTIGNQVTGLINAFANA